MQVADFEKMYAELTQSEKHSHLMLMSAITGTGKSYAVKRFLCRQAHKEPDFRAFFVTDQKKNLPTSAGFRKIWQQYNPRKDFYKHVGFIRSLPDTVQLILDEEKQRRIPSDLVSKALQEKLTNLAFQQMVYQQTAKYTPNNKTAWTDLAKAEYQVRQTLKDSLCKLAGLEDLASEDVPVAIQRYVTTTNNPACEWVNRIYPTIDIEKRQILIMTTDKFIRSYTSFFKQNGTLFQYSQVLKESLVVLDEFDSTKKQLWNKSLEETLNLKVDLLSLFRAIHQALDWKNKQIPVALQEILEKQTRIEALLKTADKYDQDYKLSYLYKTKEIQQNDNYLIHLPQYRDISATGNWYVHLNQQTNSVELDHHEAEKSIGEKFDFTEMLDNVGRFIREFAHQMLFCGEAYAQKRNLNVSASQNRISTREACYTVYDALGFSRNQIEILLGLDSGLLGSKSPSTVKFKGRKYYFQKSGLSLYEFVNAERHDLRTDINAAFFSVTPERYLLNVISKANVLGLSATAKIPTVLDNYDLTYLRQELGDHYLDGNKQITAETKAEFNLAKRYHKAGIQVDADCASVQKTIVKVMAEHDITLSPTDYQKVSEMDSRLDQQLNNIEDSSENYCRERYIGLFDSFIDFLSDETVTSYLGLQSKLPSKDDKLSASLIEEVFEGLAPILSDNEDNLPQLRVISTLLSNGDGPSIAQQIHDALRLPSDETTRVYLLSAYQTLGVGQNLQHTLSEFEKSHVRSIAGKNSQGDQRSLQADLAGMYLGDITHILTNLEGSNLDEDLVRYVTELEYLEDAEELPQNEVQAKIVAVVHGVKGRIRPKTVPSEIASIARTVIQALGRMNRTFNKNKRIKILVFNRVLDKLSEVRLPQMELSPEMQAVLSIGQVPAEPDASTEEIAKRKATKMTFRDLERLLTGGLNTNRKRANEYQNARQYLLKYPTINTKKLKQLQSQQLSCLQYLPNKELATQYQALQESQSEFSFENNYLDGPSITVSPKDAGLPSMCLYQGLEAYLKKLGYATEWQPNEWILNPVQFNNLYRGLLGEVSGQFIVEDIWSVKLQPFQELRHNELFDFKLAQHVAIDFKNWRGPHQQSIEQERQHVYHKLAQLDADSDQPWRVAIINIVSSDEVVPKLTADKRILEIPALINEAGEVVLTDDNKRDIGVFFHGE